MGTVNFLIKTFGISGFVLFIASPQTTKTELPAVVLLAAAGTLLLLVAMVKRFKTF